MSVMEQCSDPGMCRRLSSTTDCRTLSMSWLDSNAEKSSASAPDGSRTSDSMTILSLANKDHTILRSARSARQTLLAPAISRGFEVMGDNGSSRGDSNARDDSAVPVPSNGGAPDRSGGADRLDPGQVAIVAWRCRGDRERCTDRQSGFGDSSVRRY